MNDGIKAKLEDLKRLVAKLQLRSQEIQTVIHKASGEDALVISYTASKCQQTAYGIFENLTETADKHADKLIE